MSNFLFNYIPLPFLITSILNLGFHINNRIYYLVLAISAPIASAAIFYYYKSSIILNLFGFSLNLQAINNYKIILYLTLLVISFISALYSIEKQRYMELGFAHLYIFAGFAAIFAGDLITFFINVELMMLAATLIIYFGGNNNSEISASRYLIMHIFSGITILSGIVILNNDYNYNNTISLTHYLYQPNIDQNFIAALLILLGLLINIGVPPFSAWLTDSYPAASQSGTLTLASFTSKINLFTLFFLFPKLKILIFLGVFMIIYGSIYAMLENNMRRVLCYATISQMGLIVTATGLGNDEILQSAIYLLCAHILYKSLLFLAVGKIHDITNNELCSEFKGLPKNLMWLRLFIFLPFVTMIAIPYTGSFVAKKHIINELANYKYILAILANAAFTLVFLYLPLPILNSHDNSKAKKNSPSFYAIIILALFIVFSYPIKIYLVENNFLEGNYINLLNKLDSIRNHLDQALYILTSIVVAIIGSRVISKTNHILLDFDYFYRKLFNPLHFLKYDNEQSPLLYNNKIFLESVICKSRRFLSNQLSLSNNLLIVIIILSFVIIYNLKIVI